jgi:hypothetical protein
VAVLVFNHVKPILKPCRDCGKQRHALGRSRCADCGRTHERARHHQRYADPTYRAEQNARTRAWHQLHPEARRNARYRRRAVMRASDVSTRDLAALIADQRECAICCVRLSDEAHLPTSKQVDHIIPICVGGTHALDNLRIVCAHCNLTRPRDASDVFGPVSLWQVAAS